MKSVVLSAVVGAVVALVIGFYVPHGASVQAPVEKSLYDKVMEKGEISCGYVNYPPFLSKDPNTGKMSGIGVDIMTRVAELMKVKLRWAQESSWANYITDLQMNRFDVLCNTDFFLPEYVGRVEITRPVFFTGIGVYKRADDNRFPEGFAAFDDPNITISAIDGSLSMLIRNTDYPKSKIVSMPAMTDYAMILMNLAAHKADVTFVEKAVADSYMKANPGQLVNIAENKPLRVFPYFIPFKIGEVKFKSAVDEAIGSMIENGEIDRILDRYENGRPVFYRVAKGFR
jgi:ABC-type amino acid transport substrate-binding protein